MKKACGPDGVSYALLKALPIEGVTDLCNVYRRWELSPRNVGVAAAKESGHRETHLPDKCSIGQKLTWERSVPGTHVLQVALMRLLKCEVGRATGKHVVSLLVDLQCFYDSVELEQLLGAWEPLDFPPAVMNMIYEVYSGPRLLQAEQVTSRPVTCSKGILAGCPAAPS